MPILVDQIDLTASNLKNLHIKQSIFWNLVFYLEAIEAEDGGFIYSCDF